MSMEYQVNVKSQSELDIGGRETCSFCFLKLESFKSKLYKMLKIHFCEITYKSRNILSRSELLINTKLKKFFDHKAKKSR